MSPAAASRVAHTRDHPFRQRCRRQRFQRQQCATEIGNGTASVSEYVSDDGSGSKNANGRVHVHRGLYLFLGIYPSLDRVHGLRHARGAGRTVAATGAGCFYHYDPICTYQMSCGSLSRCAAAVPNRTVPSAHWPAVDIHQETGNNRLWSKAGVENRCERLPGVEPKGPSHCQRPVRMAADTLVVGCDQAPYSLAA